jgi:Arc/MetJ-type ribon-helix-helix transcriptional regulator
MTMHLPKDVETSVEAAVRAGLFGSPEEAMAEAWRAYLREKDQPQAGQAMTLDDLHQQMLVDGLLTQLPDSNLDLDLDLDDESDEPVEIDGEPLSETIIRERG